MGHLLVKPKFLEMVELGHLTIHVVGADVYCYYTHISNRHFAIDLPFTPCFIYMCVACCRTKMFPVSN
jgi:hypothetical protein